MRRKEREVTERRAVTVGSLCRGCAREPGETKDTAESNRVLLSTMRAPRLRRTLRNQQDYPSARSDHLRIVQACDQRVCMMPARRASCFVLVDIYDNPRTAYSNATQGTLSLASCVAPNFRATTRRRYAASPLAESTLRACHMLQGPFASHSRSARKLNLSRGWFHKSRTRFSIVRRYRICQADLSDKRTAKAYEHALTRERRKVREEWEGGGGQSSGRSDGLNARLIIKSRSRSIDRAC